MNLWYEGGIPYIKMNLWSDGGIPSLSNDGDAMQLQLDQCFKAVQSPVCQLGFHNNGCRYKVYVTTNIRSLIPLCLN